MYIRNKKYAEGYLTVYLTLIMTIVLSLYLALIEGVRSNAIRLEAECVMDIGLNSVLAEYHRELYRQYNLFAVDSSYGTFRSGSNNVEAHLKGYLDRNLSMEDIFLEDFFYKDFLAMSVKKAELTRVSIMTDYKGAVFREKAVEVIKDDVGIGLLEQLTEWNRIVTSQGLLERDISVEKNAIDQELNSYDGMVIRLESDSEEDTWEGRAEDTADGGDDGLRGTGEKNPGKNQAEDSEEIEEEEWVVVDINNPTDGLEQIRRKGILDAVIEDSNTLSAKVIATDTLIENRMEMQSVSKDSNTLEELSQRFFFQEYLLKYMGRYGCEDEENALLYQIEYLLSGGESDIDNLRKTADSLCALRQVANVIYIYSDEVKCAEAEVLGTVLAVACYLPEIAPLFKHTLLLGWAYAESLHDVKMILAGGRIPLLKTEDSWYYDLGSALHMGGTTDDVDEGLCYEDYLRILMSFTDMDTLTLRAMNMVEADIRTTPGNSYFRLDACYVCMEFCVGMESAYGYECEITRQKKY